MSHVRHFVDHDIALSLYIQFCGMQAYMSMSWQITVGCMNLQVMEYAIPEFGCKSTKIQYASVGIWRLNKISREVWNLKVMEFVKIWHLQVQEFESKDDDG